MSRTRKALAQNGVQLGTRVQVSARRIVLLLPAAFPWLALWQAGRSVLGASPG